MHAFQEDVVDPHLFINGQCILSQFVWWVLIHSKLANQRFLMQQITYNVMHHSITPRHVTWNRKLQHFSISITSIMPLYSSMIEAIPIEKCCIKPLIVQTIIKIKQCFFIVCMHHNNIIESHYLEVDYSIHSRYNHVSTRFA